MEIVESTSRPASVLIGTSLVVDMYWALRGASSQVLRDRHEKLAAIYGAQSILAERVATFWDDGNAGFGELVVLGQRGSVLLDADPVRVLEGLAIAGARPPGMVDLLSEENADQDLLVHRLGQLAASPTRRREYLALLTEVMTNVVMGDSDQNVVRSERAAQAMRTEFDRVGDWTALIDREFVSAAANLQRQSESAGTFAAVVLVPSAYCGRVLLFEVDGVVIVGVPAEEQGATDRREIDEVVHLLKAISDGTRLCILDLLGFRPTTVGEIATRLNLAQPTVSNHVKLLREAGFVRAQRNGARRELIVDRMNSTQLISRLEQILNKEDSEYIGRPS